MATKTLSGYLRDPLGEFSEKDKVKFQALTTEGTVIAGSVSVFDIDSTGYYEVTVQYGEFEISTRNRYTSKWTSHGVHTVDASTTATNIPALIGAPTPTSDPDLVEVQDLIQQAATAAENAQQSASDAEGYDTYITGAFESETCQVAGDVAIPEPALHVPFNDGLRVESGYETADTVEIGGDEYELDTKSVDFTRSSTSTVINKSGILTDLTADEAGIGGNGIWLHSSYTNLITYSEFNGGYPVGNASTVTATKTMNGVTLGLYEDEVEFKDYTYTSGNDLSYSLFVDLSSIPDGEYAELAVESRGSTRDYITVNIYNDATIYEADSSDSWSYEVEMVSSEMIRLHFYYNSSIYSYANSTARIVVFDNSDGSYCYFGGFQLVEGIKNKIPYIETTSTTSTVTPTLSSVSANGNLPPVGSPFSIECDVGFPSYGSGVSGLRYAFFVGDTGTTTPFIGLMRFSTGDVVFRFNGIDHTLYLGIDDNDYSIYRFVITYDGIDVNCYVNGELSETESGVGDIDYSGVENIYIGSYPSGNGSLNSQLKNFKIYHSALTADQVKALGAA